MNAQVYVRALAWLGWDGNVMRLCLSLACKSEDERQRWCMFSFWLRISAFRGIPSAVPSLVGAPRPRYTWARNRTHIRWVHVTNAHIHIGLHESFFKNTLLQYVFHHLPDISSTSEPVPQVKLRVCMSSVNQYISNRKMTKRHNTVQ